MNKKQSSIIYHGGIVLNFPEALVYLQQLTRFGFNFGLDRITELLRRVDNPHFALKVVHIGGTNGKGSTAAMLNAILQEGGFRVGMFTSPHLHAYTERYRINGQEIEQQEMAALITELKPHLDAMVKEGYEHPTEFEVSTALAFMYFQRQHVDYLILEVGLGGLIDSTNVVQPVATVITNVAMDHMDYLGNTIEEIATIKAGIIKPGIPLVTSATGKALAIIKDVCAEKKAPLMIAGVDFCWQEQDWNVEQQRILITGLLDAYTVDILLKGRHQQINAALAVATAEILQQSGAFLTKDMISQGVLHTIWPARMEIVSQNPLVMIDGAHNVDGAIALGQALDEYFPNKDIIMVLGMLGDKERAKVVKELAPRAKAVIITKPNNARAGDWQSMAQEALHFIPQVETIENIREAVQRAMDMAGTNDMVCITGSLYMVA